MVFNEENLLEYLEENKDKPNFLKAQEIVSWARLHFQTLEDRLKDLTDEDLIELGNNY